MNEQTIDVLAFGAHPDDVEIGCGGTLYKLHQMGYSTGIIDLTEGEMGTRGSVEERYEEAAAAAKILNLSIRENLKIPDGGIEATKENRHKIIEIVRRYKPEIVFVHHSDDRHPDHIYTNRLVTEACFYSGLKKVDVKGLLPHRPKRIVYYPISYEFTPSFVVDISEEFEVKLQAIRAYRSQFYNPEYKGEKTFISSKEFMDNFESRARYYGWIGGVKYAEPFWVREAIVLDDLFSSLTKNKM